MSEKLASGAAFLEQACAGDAELRAEVERLLAYDEQESRFMETPAFVAEEALRGADPASSIVGQRIGPYKVLHEIGHGGMGAVYLAERDDDEYKKQVAIKLVKRGMDTDAILRRFRNERQILANLDHPHIAKLLDGSTTEDGLSYFVMDYVEGLPIDVYCDTHQLATLEVSKRQYVPRYHIAIIYAGLGDKNQALAWLEKAYEERDGWLVWLKVEPMVDSLRSDPRFTELLERLPP